MSTSSTSTRDRAPRVSLLIPVHDHEAFLDETMRSALAQTYDDYEVIVLDDGSTDASLRVLRRYEVDPRVTVLTQENIGPEALHRPFNRLVEAARGELLAWQGGDDASVPDRLSTQVSLFDEDPGVDVCHSAAWQMDGLGSPVSIPAWPLRVPYDEFSVLRTVLGDNFVGHPTVMMRRDAHEKVGLFEEGYVCDHHMWLKSADRLRFRYLPRKLIRYRLHERSLSTSVGGRPRATAESCRVRALRMQGCSITDFYPELLGVEDRQTAHEAGLDLGNSLIGLDPDAALVAYDLAAAEMDSADLHHDRAVAHLVRGDRDAAITSAVAAAAVDPSSDLVELARGERTGQVTLRSPRALLDAALARARTDRHPIRWDGSPSHVRRAYVSPPADPDLVRVSLASWVSGTAAGGAERWVVPSLGRRPQDLFEHLATAAASMDVASAGDIVIEEVEDMALLPPEASRLTGTLRTIEDVAVFDDWVSSGAGTGRR